METIVAAAITGVLALIGVIITVVATVRKANNDLLKELQKQIELNRTELNAKLDKFQAVTDTKIEELTREVRKHNNFAERMPALEEKVEGLKDRMDRSYNDGK